MNGLTSEKFFNSRWWMGDMTLFEALAGGASDPLKCQHTGKLRVKIFKTSQMPGGLPGEGGGGKGGFGLRHLHISHNAPYLPPPPKKKKKKNCLSIVFNFSLDSRNTQEK